ncbi:MAG: glycosyl hydrolase family 28 protein [Chthoniobacteraceae bacterium]
MKTLLYPGAVLAAFFLILQPTHAAGGTANVVTTFSAPAGVALNDDFQVQARAPGGPWQEVPTYLIKVRAVRGDDALGVERRPESSSMASFDFSGTAEVAVTFRHGRIHSARIRPLSYGIQPVVQGNRLTFPLTQPRNLSIEINGDLFHNLHLFANAPAPALPDLKDPHVIYFGPGLHVLPKKHLDVASGQTVYLAGGAVVRGSILINWAKNVRVLGHGILEQSGKGMGAVRISHSANVEVNGLIGSQFFTGGSRNVTIRNVKCLSYVGNGDGMNVFCSRDVLIDGVFNRNSDDCFTVYGTRGEFSGSASQITLRNSTLWADVAHPVLIGTHGNAKKPDTLENITVCNVDILDHMEQQLDYQGCLSINVGDNNLVRNVRFENIRVEDFREGQLLNLRVFFNRKYCAAPGRGIENVLFKNVSYRGRQANPSIIEGYDDTRKIRNVRFENLSINGILISDHMKKPGWFKTSDLAHIYVGEHVEKLQFQSGGNAN